MKIFDFINLTQERLDTLFKHYLIEQSQPAITLKESISYAAMNGGKRIRPLLVYLTNHALNGSLENADPAACAIEFIHIYSLIHDDLPAMDNSDLRRGKPSCHKVFGEAMAILAGDALQPLAFEVIAKHPCTLNATQRLEMIQILSQASGMQGMAAGQALDLTGMQTLPGLTEMYQLKTGALLSASVQLGAVSANINDKEALTCLEKFAKCIGLAFQIQDDLLDIQGETHLTGKPKGIDSTNSKITYPSLVGVELSRHKIQELFDTALDSIKFLGAQGQILRELTHHLLQREK
jgi:geranylgeranyl pyrophosphate synthase